MAERHQGKSHLALSIDIEQGIDRVVHKTAHHFGRQTQRRGDGQQVGEQGAVVPAEMAVGAVLILPGVAPVRASADDGQRSLGDCGFGGGGLDQDAAIVSGAQFAQAELGGGEVIDAGFEIVRQKIAADQIEFDLVKRSGASGGAKVDFAAGVFSVPGDAGGQIEQLSDGFQVRRRRRFAAGTISEMAERAATPVWRTSAGNGDGSRVG